MPISLVVGENSFATKAELMGMLQQLPHLTALATADEEIRQGALVAAYDNICLMQPHPETLLVDRFHDLTAEHLTDYHLGPRTRRQLLRAQLIEANLVLGGDPIADRRRVGMISDSNGESAQFFRTAIPLRLPVYRDTAEALTGLISYTARVGRG